MRINFYEARLSEDDRTMLVKEKGVNYEAGKLSSPKDIVLMMRRLLQMEQMAEEHCYIVALDNANKVIGIFLLSKGTVNECLISPREVFMRALLIGAVGIILCHNHPSGDVTPSNADMEITKRLKEAGKLINIALTDHIIIGADQYFSFGEAGILRKDGAL